MLSPSKDKDRNKDKDKDKDKRRLIDGPVGDGELEVGVRDIMVRILYLPFSHYWQISYFPAQPIYGPSGKVIWNEDWKR